MKYTKEERIEIGRQVYTRELLRKDAIEKYDISDSTIDIYVNNYKQAAGIPCHELAKNIGAQTAKTKAVSKHHNADIEAYMAMSKEELINELILAKVNEARAKKGYEVKGVGADKEFIFLNSKNSKS